MNIPLFFLKSLAGGSVLLKVTVCINGRSDLKGKEFDWKVTVLALPVFFVGDEGRCRGKSFPIFRLNLVLRSVRLKNLNFCFL